MSADPRAPDAGLAALNPVLAGPEPLMRRALALAALGRASTHPNPRVGCVIVNEGGVVGEGWHVRAGEPHGEVHALRAAGERARGATAYVTLEPCAHTGRTPPCADALIAAGVARVVIAMPDPFPQVAGRGIERLQAAGIAVDVGLCADEARAMNRGFLSRVERGRPWLTLKLAMSLDARTAMASGESRWITGPAARADVHRLRAEAGAVMTTSATVLADDPELNVRLPAEADGPGHAVLGEAARAPLAAAAAQRAVQDSVPELRQPDRIVLDARGRVPAGARVWAPGARRFALQAVGLALPRPDGVEAIALETTAAGAISLPGALAALAARGVNELFVECGPGFAGALLQAGLVDELLVYTAPKLLGDAARPLVRLPGLERLAEHIALRFTSAEMLGDDLKITARIAGRE